MAGNSDDFATPITIYDGGVVIYLTDEVRIGERSIRNWGTRISRSQKIASQMKELRRLHRREMYAHFNGK
jgi:hypothetical protein